MQAQPVEWTKHLSHEALATVTSVEMDELGNSYISGVFEDNFLLEDVWLSSVGGRDIYVAKLSSTGDLIWAKSFGSEEDDNITALKVTNEKIVIGGNFWRSIQFDAVELNTIISESGLFYAQLNTTGEVNWARVINSVGNKALSALSIHPITSDVAVLSTFTEGRNMDNKLITTIVANSVDQTGNLIWANTLQIQGNGRGIGIDYFEDEAVAITGNFEGTINNIDIIQTNTTDSDAFVWKIDERGNSLWLRKAGGVFQDEAVDLTIHNDQIFIAGSFVGVLSLNDSLQIQSIGFNDNAFLLAYDTSGNTLWAKSIGSEALEKCNDLAIYEDQIALVGYYLDQLTIESFSFAGSPTSFAGFFITTQLDGSITDVQAFRSSQNLFLNAVALSEKATLLVGDFEGMVTLLDTTYQSNIFNPLLIQLGTTVSTTDNIPEASFQISATPVGIEIITTLKNYEARLFNASGQLSMQFTNEPFLPTQHLPTGIYFLEIRSNKGQFTYKLSLTH